MDLSVIIVNWNVRPLLERCLDSIFKETKDLDYEVIVVDNASRDKSREYLEQIADKRDNLKIILNKENVGFAKANNQGLKIARGEFILFLNPDTEILPAQGWSASGGDSAITRLVKLMRQHSDWGILGCQLIDVDGRVQPSVRNFPTFWSQFFIFLKIHHWLPNLKPLKKYFLYDFNYEREQEVEQVMGAYLLTRRKLVEAASGFDEKFFLWFEEVDFCRRIKETSQWKIIYEPTIKIRHFGHQSFRQIMPYRKQKIYNQSAIYYFQKHHPRWQTKILAKLQPISLLLAVVIDFNHRLLKQFYEPRDL